LIDSHSGGHDCSNAKNLKNSIVKVFKNQSAQSFDLWDLLFIGSESICKII
jgi:hypothetical protein